MPGYFPTTIGRRDVVLPRSMDDVLDRVGELKQARDATLDAMMRTTSMMDGGKAAIAAMLGPDSREDVRDMPIANYMSDAAEAFATRLGGSPDLRVDPPTTGKKADENQSRTRAAEKRARIVAAYDADPASPLTLMMPMLARWVPGASFATITIDPVMENGYPYPRARLRSPLDTMIPQSSPVNPAREVGYVHRISLRELIALFPEHTATLNKLREAGPAWPGGAVLLDRTRTEMGVDVVTYYDAHGTWWVLPEQRILLDFTVNPLKSGPAFVAFTKFNYNRMRGEYDDMIGPMISMARLQILSEVAVRKDVAQPTNLFTGAGGPLTGNYRQGFSAVNIFDVNARVEIPNGTVQFQAWQQLDRLERTLRIEGTSPLQDSGESPMSFVTGRGMNALAERVERGVAEYQKVFKHGLERKDALQLEYDERAWPDIRKPMAGVRKGAQFEEEYTPSRDIKGNHRTSREYGAMAALDEATKMNGLLIMDQAEWVSKKWVRSQLNEPGISETEMERQIQNEQTQAILRQYLMTHATEPESPEHMRALRIAVELLPQGDWRELFETWIADIESAQAEQAQAQQQMQPGGGQPPPPEEVMAMLQGGGTPTTLSRTTVEGEPAGGSQIVMTS